MMNDQELKPGWQTYRFDQIAINVNDRVEPGDTDLEYYVGLEHLDSDSLKIRRWGKPDDVGATKLRFRKGDIIFGRRRVYQRKLAVADFDGICSAHAMVLRPNPDAILPEFLPFFMQSEVFMNRALEISVGSLSPTINWRTLAAQEFPLPPPDEQRRLVEALSLVNEVLNDYAEAVQAIHTLRASIRNQEFDPSNNKTLLLADLCNDGDGIQIGPFGSQLHQSDYVEKGIPVVMPANMLKDQISVENIARISEEKANQLSMYWIQAGDILLPRRGELDRRAYVEEQHTGFLCGTGSIRIRIAKEHYSKAVFHALASTHSVRWLTANAVGTTMLNLNSTIVGQVPIALPSKARQETVVRQLEDLEANAKNLEKRLGSAKSIKNMLKTQLVEGHL